MAGTEPTLDQLRTEGDINLSPRRARFEAEHLSANTRAMLEEDAHWFLDQAWTILRQVLDEVAGVRPGHGQPASPPAAPGSGAS